MEDDGSTRRNRPSVVPAWLIIFVFLACLISDPASLCAKPMSGPQTEKTIRGWLKLDPNPLGTPLGNEIGQIDVFSDDNGQPVYRVVYLQPSGFVIVPADDLVEPIIAFAGDGTFDPSEDNPLGALVSRDIPSRISAVRELQANLSAEAQKQLTTEQEALQKACSKAQDKWNSFQAASDGKIKIAGLSSISDVRVSPLLQSEWSQSNVCGQACYNYYTPPYEDGNSANYVCGCVATAIAQLIRYHEYPTSGIGINEFTIYIEGVSTTAYTRGGDGSGGPYNWGQMVLEPGCGITPAQRQAIGALCYDAGLIVNMNYGRGGSGAVIWKIKDELPNTFGYSNAIDGRSVGDLSGPGLNGMVNPNLDASYPSLLGIRGLGGHAVVADGYGYDSLTLYHHINMGWGGSADAWYNLPDIPSFNRVSECIYNVFITGSGEIISGRVIDDSNNPISGALVNAVKTGGGTYNDTTDSNGIYALAKIPSASTYNISVTKFGYSFTDQNAATGTSTDFFDTSGNVWGVDFVGAPSAADCNSVAIGTGTLAWGYPMYTYYHDSRTQVIYLGSDIGTSGNITELALDVETVPDQEMNYWTIRMKHTSMDSYSTASLDATGWTIVYHANEPVGTTGWRTFTFSTPFGYNGTDNLLIDFSHNNDSYSSQGKCRYSTPGGTRSVYARSDSDHGDPLDWSGTSSPTVFGSTKVPNVQLNICSGILGDFELDGDVDLYDFAVLGSAWRSSPGDDNWDQACDISDPNDNVINELDADVFCENWLAGP